MAGFITLPQHRNPWMEQLPQFVQQLAFQKIGQKFQKSQAKEQQDFEKQERVKDRDFTAGQAGIGRDFDTEQNRLSRVHQTNQARIARDFELGKIKDSREYDAILLEDKNKYDERKTLVDRSFQLRQTHDPVDQQNLPAGVPSIYDPITNKHFVRRPNEPQTLKGDEFYHQYNAATDSWKSTGVKSPKPAAGVNVYTGDTGEVGDPLSSNSSLQPRVDFEAAAKTGTGLWANVASTIDAVGGGVGIDKLFGKEGFFKDTQDARQNIRLLKQLGKSALMNSARGPIWEQKMIQELFPVENDFFTNPRTEARKIPKLRETLKAERDFKVSSLSVTTDKVLARELRKSIVDIDRIRNMIGPPQGQVRTKEDDALIKKYLTP